MTRHYLKLNDKERRKEGGGGEGGRVGQSLAQGDWEVQVSLWHPSGGGGEGVSERPCHLGPAFLLEWLCFAEFPPGDQGLEVAGRSTGLLQVYGLEE